MGRAASISTGIIQVMTWMWTLRRGTDWTRELLLPTDDLLQRVANLVSPPSSLVVLLSEASSPYKHSSVWNHSHSQVVQIWCLGFSACAFFFFFLSLCSHSFLDSTKTKNTHRSLTPNHHHHRPGKHVPCLPSAACSVLSGGVKVSAAVPTHTRSQYKPPSRPFFFFSFHFLSA